MNVQKSIQRAHASSFLISLMVNGVLIFLLLSFVNLPPSTGPNPRSVTITPQTQTEDTLIQVPDVKKPEIRDVTKPDFQDPLLNVTPLADEAMRALSQTPHPVVLSDVGKKINMLEGVEGVVNLTRVHDIRTPNRRKEAIQKYDPGLNGETELAVIKALHWLDQVQVKSGPDLGAWRLKGETGAPNAGMTGLALLTFLAHGETISTEQYGETVTAGLRYLLKHQDADGIFQPAGSHTGYGHAMATYAVAEAYTLTDNVMLEEPLLRALQAISDGRNPTGGFDYEYRQRSAKTGGPRSDNSLNAWHVQALKAATISGIGGDHLNRELQDAVLAMLAVSGKRAEGGRGFAYSNSKEFQQNKKGVNNKLLSSAGLLCLQLTGRADSREARETMKFVETFAHSDDLPEWEKQTVPSYGGELNHWYYTIQAYFHDNPKGRDFQTYMLAMSRALMDHQQEDGRWVCFSSNGQKHGPVYSTTLAALSLMVYYRYLPTTQADNLQKAHDGEGAHWDDDDIRIPL